MSDNQDQDVDVSADVLAVIEGTGEMLGKAASRPDGPDWCAEFLAGRARIVITADRLSVEPVDDDGPSLSVGMYL